VHEVQKTEVKMSGLYLVKFPGKMKHSTDVHIANGSGTGPYKSRCNQEGVSDEDKGWELVYLPYPPLGDVVCKKCIN
jgi:hypothetical protein